MSEQVPAGGVELSPAEIEALDARWSSCWTPAEVARRLAGTAVPWCVAAGWALDLFRGEQTRKHGDIEIAVPAGSFAEVRDRFPGYVFDAAGSGRTWVCRHDEVIRFPYREIIHHTAGGIPYLAPELVLLFKARHARPKDQSDFERTVPHLSPAQRASLAGLLTRLYPGHRWLAALPS